MLKNVCLAALAFYLHACQKDAPVNAPSRQVFSGKGIVKELQLDGKTVVVQHEAISNYMAAMTMPFEVHDTNELRGLKSGDAISFHLFVTPTEGWIGDIIRQRNPSNLPPAVTSSSDLQISRAVTPLDEGDMMPEYHFTNELGQPVNLSQYKGSVMAFTFFFTSCPFPNFCPRMTANFASAAAQLNQMPNAPTNWHLLSVSFDPKTDAPARLLAYAENSHYDSAHWSFLTGAPEQISEFADQFGENFWNEGGSISHNLRMVVVDAKGRIRKIYQGNGWTGSDLVGEMIKAAGK